MIDPALIPKLRALWAEADAAFRTDDAYVIDMAEESAKVHAKRRGIRARSEAAAVKRAKRRGHVGGAE